MTDTSATPALPALPESSELPPGIDAIQQTAWINLTHYALIRVGGPDAQKLLQGQFTCDLNDITTERSRLGACCTPKGRMLALFRIARVGEEFWLRLPRALAQPLVDHLKKFAVFFKATLALDANALILGLTGALPGLDLPEDRLDATRATTDGVLIRVPGAQPRYELWGSEEGLARMIPHLNKQPQQPIHWWELAEILAGVGEVYAETRESFIPQMLNLQSLGGIAFKKGCYTGQEIVARMQYLGTLKRRMYLARIDAAISVPPGATIVDASGSALGTVVRAQPTAQQTTELLAVLAQEELASEAPLYLETDGAPQGDQALQNQKPRLALHWRDVPYSVETIRNERKKL